MEDIMSQMTVVPTIFGCVWNEAAYWFVTPINVFSPLQTFQVAYIKHLFEAQKGKKRKKRKKKNWTKDFGF